MASDPWRPIHLGDRRQRDCWEANEMAGHYAETLTNPGLGISVSAWNDLPKSRRFSLCKAGSAGAACCGLMTAKQLDLVLNTGDVDQ